MAVMNERDKLVHSIVRFLLGFRPEYGSCYYFEKSRARSSVYRFVDSVKARISGLQCPFCDKRFRRRSALATHLMKIHYHDILTIAGIE
jgi:hypothetical protein